jgi:hypothetical protein
MRLYVRVCIVLILVVGVAASGYGADKSMRKALLLSLLVPGAGQQYIGSVGRARMMYAAEVGIWSTFTVFRIQGGMRKDRYEEMATLYAGVDGDRGDDYYRVISYYESNDDYNIDVRREARARYPDDRDAQLAFYGENAYFGEDAWSWESPARRSEFANTRTLSRRAYRRAVLTTGFAVLNRLVSAVDVYLAFRLDRVGSQVSYPMLRAGARPDQGFGLYISKSF